MTPPELGAIVRHESGVYFCVEKRSKSSSGQIYLWFNITDGRLPIEECQSVTPQDFESTFFMIENDRYVEFTSEIKNGELWLINTEQPSRAIVLPLPDAKAKIPDFKPGAHCELPHPVGTIVRLKNSDLTYQVKSSEPSEYLNHPTSAINHQYQLSSGVGGAIGRWYHHQLSLDG